MGLHAILRDKYPLLAKNLYKKYIPSAIKVKSIKKQVSQAYAYIDAY